MIAEERMTPNDQGARDELHHYICDCNEDIALCGRDVSGEAWLQYVDPEDECIVCVMLLDSACRFCGRTRSEP
jgi:hypothetical protein